MFRITAYADRLLEDLDLVEWPESTRAMQTEWIGRSEGAEIDFEIPNLKSQISDSQISNFKSQISEISKLRVFTTRPDTVFGATYMVVAPEHPLIDQVLEHPQPETDVEKLRAYVEAAKNKSDVDRQADIKEKTGVFTGVHATNPATGEKIAVWTSDYVLMGYGHGAIMAVPGHDQRDFEFAQKFDLPIVKVVEPAEKPTDSHPWASDNPREWETSFDGDGFAVNSANNDVSLNGLPTPEAKQRIIEWLEQTKRGVRKINYRLRDWLFSRQRYWGEPFPIVFDEDGNHYPIAEENLPVELPPLQDFQPIESDEPMPLLAKATDWVKTTAGEAGVSPDLAAARIRRSRARRTRCRAGPARAGMSCASAIRRMMSDSSAARRNVLDGRERAMVDLYIGGAEHAVLHLLYARFWHKILYDLGEVSTPEPFAKLFHQGMIVSFAYSRADKSLVPIDEVEEREDGVFIETATGERVTQVIAKMSKSLKNIENPDHVIAEFGADTFRLYEMYMGPLEATKPWNTRDIAGCYRFLQRVWRLVVNEETGELTLATRIGINREAAAPHHQEGRRRHRASRVQHRHRCDDRVHQRGDKRWRHHARSARTLRRHPLALSHPHMAEELWAKLGREPSIANVPWPTCR
jgi:leucyl-tRNA synthetase